MPKTPETIEVRDRTEWREWLATHHHQKQSINLVMYRKGADERYIPYEEIVEEALCFDWIDSTRRKLDDGRAILLIAPRKKGSAWSRVNKERVKRLAAEGLMMPAGLEKIEQAKQDGSWSRYDAVEALDIPDDLAEAFRRHPGSAGNFNAFPPSSRREMLAWVVDAKRPETRAQRIEEIARRAAANERAR